MKILTKHILLLLVLLSAADILHAAGPAAYSSTPGRIVNGFESTQTNSYDDFLPFEGSVTFTVHEEYLPYPHSEGTPSIVIQLKTGRKYGCSNYQIDSQFSIVSSDITVRLIGIGVPNLCLTAVGPATKRIPLDIVPGQYNLSFVYGSSVEKYAMLISNEKIVVKGTSHALTEPIDQTYWRFPKNSFVYTCGASTEFSEICEDFHKRLMQTGDFREFHFQSGGKAPYPTMTNGYYYNMPVRYYAYAKSDDYTRAGALLREFKHKTIRSIMGVNLTLRNWENKEYASWKAME